MDRLNRMGNLRLRAKDPLSGIRAFEDINNKMIKNVSDLIEDYDKLAHNRTLVYQRLEFKKSR